MPKRPSSPFLAIMACLLLSPSTVYAATYKILSQNTLHLGWGASAYQTVKNNFFKTTAVPNYDVVLLQEVMDDTIDAQIKPGAYTWYVSSAKGKGSYMERYGFLVKSGMTVNGGLYDYGDAAGEFMRPPSGLMVKKGTQWTWLINYHAVYGTSKSVRVTEVSKTNKVYNAFAATAVGSSATKTDRIVMAGDWNLKGTDSAFNNLKVVAGGVNAQVLPDVKTSLKTNGGLSQPYDHFVWDKSKVTLSNVGVVYAPGGGMDCTNPPPSAGTNCSAFRNAISDHLGITATVTD